METLYEAVRKECSPLIWSRAEQLSRTGQVDGRRTHNDEIELRIVTRGGMVSPRVVLSPKDDDWSCECPSEDAACVHVAAAVISLRSAQQRDEAPPRVRAPSARLAYRLERKDGALVLKRCLNRDGKLTPLEQRLTAARAQDKDGDIAASQADIALDLALGSMLEGKLPRVLIERVLAALAECTDVSLDGHKVDVGAPRPVLHVRVDDHPDGFRVFAEQDPAITEIFENGAVLQGKSLRAIGALELSGRDVEELRNGRVYEFGAVADLVGRVLPALQARMPVQVRSKLLPSATPMQPRISFRVEHDGSSLGVLPTLVYGDPPVARVDGGKLHYLGGALAVRNERAEERLQRELEARLELRVGHISRFQGLGALGMADRLRAWQGASIEGDGLEGCFEYGMLEADFEIDSELPELRFKATGERGTRGASAAAVVRAWQAGETLVPLIDGGWAALPHDLLARCGHIIADLVAAADEQAKLPPSALPDLARLCEALDRPPPASLGRLRTLVQGFDRLPEAPLPADLTAQLRDYQREGVDWLTFLSGAGMGAMLADDMGLGKTLQALCALGTPTLVVAPASVLHNWAAEITRFRPMLRAATYHGPGRALDPGADVTLTTYAILRSDVERLEQVQWDTVILDEAQNIKNAESQVAQAAFRLPARFRMTLTGTPVENRLEELWSQFHFLNKGLLGGRRDFQERYARPISDGDARVVEHLRTRIRPFTMRRLKREVARELPPRTDVVLRCELDEQERNVYDAVRAATQAEVVQQLQAGGSVIAALEALLRLRQACCHAALLPGRTANDSSKLRLLMDTLDKALAEGHKALIFSQWTSLLDLVEPHLNSAGIVFTRLDGSTRDRGEVVARFQDPAGPPVMLVSLKAGGTGLNLTEADNVFLLDPWWNPAVEEQAADRAHRIGQVRPVLVQRLVATDTVEERMLLLQDKKRALAEAAMSGATGSGGLTREDLLGLLS
jgi:superfamily II DNA or RNA helicase